MQRRHFEYIANTVRKHGGERRDVLALDFALWLAQENPRFDRDKFLTACGMTP
jgi:hypothetical protein